MHSRSSSLAQIGVALATLIIGSEAVSNSTSASSNSTTSVSSSTSGTASSSSSTSISSSSSNGTFSTTTAGNSTITATSSAASPSSGGVCEDINILTLFNPDIFALGLPGIESKFNSLQQLFGTYERNKAEPTSLIKNTPAFSSYTASVVSELDGLVTSLLGNNGYAAAFAFGFLGDACRFSTCSKQYEEESSLAVAQSKKFDPQNYIARPPCCDQCTVYGQGVQLSYWPTPAPSGAPATLVDAANHTFVSPSVYGVFTGLSAVNRCGLVGGTIPIKTLTFGQSELRTSSIPHPTQLGDPTFGNWTAINYADFADNKCACTTNCEYDPYFDRTFTYTCTPQLSIPAQISALDPAWAACAPDLGGVFDPPIALSAAGGLTTPKSNPSTPTPGTGNPNPNPPSNPPPSPPPAVPANSPVPPIVNPTPPPTPPSPPAPVNPPPAPVNPAPAPVNPPPAPVNPQPVNPPPAPANSPSSPQNSPSNPGGANSPVNPQPGSGNSPPSSGANIPSNPQNSPPNSGGGNNPVSPQPGPGNTPGSGSNGNQGNSPPIPVEPGAQAGSPTLGLVVGGSTSLISPLGSGASGNTPVITINGQPITANSQGNFVVGTQTLSPGGAPIVVSGTSVSLAVVPAGATPPPSITVNGQVVTANAQGNFVIGTQTITPGGSGATIGGSVVSIPAAGTTSPTVLTINGQIVTANAQGNFVIGTQTLTPGATAITVSGTVISLAPGATEVVIGGSTSTIRPGTSATGTGSASLPLYTGSASSGFEVLIKRTLSVAIGIAIFMI